MLKKNKYTLFIITGMHVNYEHDLDFYDKLNLIQIDVYAEHLEHNNNVYMFFDKGKIIGYYPVDRTIIKFIEYNIRDNDIL